MVQKIGSDFEMHKTSQREFKKKKKDIADDRDQKRKEMVITWQSLHYK